jgi:hypothetical protein
MTHPKVIGVCLTTNTRPEMLARAVRCMERQDYPYFQYTIFHGKGTTVGVARNEGNAQAAKIGAEVIAHFDDDDISAPARISDQVKLLVESGKQAVGYREMLFWSLVDHKFPTDRVFRGGRLGEAWLYRNTDPRYIISTSACYWRRTWEDKPFDDVPTGEVGRWIKGLETLGVPGIGARFAKGLTYAAADEPLVEEPHMLATLHGGNTCPQHIFPAATNPDGSLTWTRVSSWDERCRELLEAA